MRKEVISNEEAKEDKVVNNALELEPKWKIHILEFKVQIFSSYVEFDELELDRSRETDLASTGCLDLGAFRNEMTLLATFCALLFELCHKGFPEDTKVRFMSAQAKHDKVSISPIHAMPSVWIVPWLASLGADEVQDLVFSLSRDRSIRKDDLESLPKMIILEAISDIILQRLGESVHKLSSRSDDIFIKLYQFINTLIAYIHCLSPRARQ